MWSFSSLEISPDFSGFLEPPVFTINSSAPLPSVPKEKSPISANPSVETNTDISFVFWVNVFRIGFGSYK